MNQKRIAIFQPLTWQKAPLLDLSPLLLLTGSAGGGKALALNTIVPTTQGLKWMGEIEVGDQVITPQGMPTKVTAISEIFSDHYCFQIGFSNGEKVQCDSSHLWEVSTPHDLRHTKPFVITTEQLYLYKPDIEIRSYACTVTIKSITPIDPIPVRCLEVEHKAGTFVITKSRITTHNSRLAAEKIHAYLKKYPNTMGLMLRKQRQSMTNSTVLFFDRAIIGSDPTVRHFPSKLRFEYDNGSILAYGGMDGEEQKEQIRSIGQDGSVHIAWMEEANRFTEEDFNELLARMRGTGVPWRQIILTTNPDAPTHWIYRRMILGKEAKVYYSKARDNTYNPDEYVGTLQKLTGVAKERLADGKWVMASGAIYPEFDPEIHVIDSFDIPKDWRRVRAVDFGFTNPFVAHWGALDEDGRLYIYREIYMSGRTVRVHGEQINYFTREKDEEIEITVCDHDAEDRLTLEENEIYNIAANKDVEAGIGKVRDRLKVQKDGRPRIMYFRDMLVERDPEMDRRKKPASVLEELPSYAWAKTQDGMTIKEVPLKLNDHGCDCDRYLCMYLDGQDDLGMDYG